MSKIGILCIVLTAILVAAGTLRSNEAAAPTTPEGAVQSLFARVKSHELIHGAGGLLGAKRREQQFSSAYSFVANTSEISATDFVGDLLGTNGSLRTTSNLQTVNTKLLSQNGSEAMVRAD